MTVLDLIEKLNALPPSARVFRADAEWGPTEVTDVTAEPVEFYDEQSNRCLAEGVVLA